MKSSLQLAVTLSGDYNVAWSHLNHQVDLCEARMTQPRVVEVSEDGDYVSQALVTLRPDELAQAKQVWKASKKDLPYSFERVMNGAIGDYFDSSCRCEHDCCGHVNTSGRARRVGRRTWLVKIRATRNV
jgi:hypothetical protein